MKNVFLLEKETKVNKLNSYIYSYLFILDFFRSKSVLEVSDIVCGLNMIYGWMPTSLNIDVIKFKENEIYVIEIFNKIKSGSCLCEDDINLLVSVSNNSLVGVSKLLHFVSPNCYPIWDSRVYRFIYNMQPYN